jgi:hypothetical protein
MVVWSSSIGLIGGSCCTGMRQVPAASRNACCHWSSRGWRTGSRPWSSDRRGNRHSWGSRHYTSTATGHLLRLPGLRISCLRISRLRKFGLPAAGLWISGLLGIPRLLRSSGLWVPRPLTTASLPLRGLRIAKQFGIPRLLRTPGLYAAKRLGTASLPRWSGLWISEPAALFSVLRLRKSGRWLFRRSPFGELVAWGRLRDRAC